MNKTMKVEGPLHVVCQCDKCKAQPEQEPVEVCCGDYHKCSKPCTPRGRYYGEKLAPKRPWVGLTDDEVFECENSVPDKVVSDRDWCLYLGKTIGAKLEEKNT